MTEVGDTTVCIIDTGLLGIPMALRMAEEAKRVLFWNPDQRGFPSMKQGCIGDGFEDRGVERINEIWPQLGDIGLFCFPDCQHAGLQEYLESQGYPVWGSRKGIELELCREKFMGQLANWNLDVPGFEVKVGINELTSYLRDREDIYVKISRWRGDMETTHWRNWAMDSGWLDWLAVNLGPLRHRIRFLCFDKIDTKLEIGGDLYAVDDQYPSKMLNGIEGKDKCYFAAVTDRDKMPHQIQSILAVIEPNLARYRYRNQMSLEVRVLGDQSFWIDATQRGGMPSTASQHKLMANFPQVVLAGAHGELLEPEYTAKFSIECMITTKPDNTCWDVVEIPKELEPWARFSNCCYVDGCYCFPPDEMHGGDLGWLCAIGDTPREVLDHAKELADLLPDGLNADVEALSDIIKEIGEMDKADIPFTEQKLPEPAEVLT